MADELRVRLETGPKGKRVVVAVAPDWTGLGDVDSARRGLSASGLDLGDDPRQRVQPPSGETTRAPRAASSRAVAAPMPALAPVIATTWSSSSMMAPQAVSTDTIKQTCLRPMLTFSGRPTP